MPSKALKRAWLGIRNNGNREYAQSRYDAMKTVALDMLGGARCVECGFDDPRALVFDHIADDGAEHRAETSAKTVVHWIFENPTDAREKLQVLCANCNTIKEFKRRRPTASEVRPASEAPALG